MKSHSLLISSCVSFVLAMQGCNTLIDDDSTDESQTTSISTSASSAFTVGTSQVTLEEVESYFNNNPEVVKYVQSKDIDVNNLFVKFKDADNFSAEDLENLKVEDALDIIDMIENRLFEADKTLSAAKRTDRVRLIPVSQKKDNFGNTYYRYTLSYNNLPFFDKDIISQVDKNKIIKIISGQYHQTTYRY